MKRASIVIRMYWRDLVRIKKEFPAKRGEAMCDYIERLAEYLETKK